MNGIFKGKIYGSTTIGERGQVVIPAEVRKLFKVKAGDKLIVLAKPEKKMMVLIPVEDFSKFLDRASKIISKLEKKVSRTKIS